MVSMSDLKMYQTDSSLGPFNGSGISSTEIISGSPNNIFTNIPKNELVIGKDYYRGFFIRNKNASESMDNFKMWLESKSFPRDTQLKWGFDPIVLKSVPYLRFDGLTDYVDCGNEATLWSKSLTKFSFSVWIYPTAAGDGNDRVVVSHGGSSNQGFRLFVDQTTSTKVRFVIKDSGGTSYTASSTAMVKKQWNQIICSYDNSLVTDNVRIYVNGVIGTSANFTGSINISANLTLSESSTDYKGYMKDFRFWSDESTNDSDAALLYSGSDADTPDYWLKIDEGINNPKDTISLGVKTATLVTPKWINIGNMQEIQSVYDAPLNVVWQSVGGPPQTISSAVGLSIYHYEPYQIFNGEDDLIDVADAAPLDLNQFSISAWFRTSKNYRSDPFDSAGQEGMIVMKGRWVHPNPPYINYGLWVTDTNGLRGGFEESDGTDHLAKIFRSNPDEWTPGEVVVNDGKWHMGTVTYDGATVNLYLDSVLMDSRAASGTPDTGSTPLRIGANNFDTSDPDWEMNTMFFKGDIDEVRVWNNDLTPSEISDLYTDGTVPQGGAIVYENKFGTDINFPADSTPGKLAAGKAIPIWLWRHVDANAEARIDDNGIFKFNFDIPLGGTAPPPTDTGGTGGTPPPTVDDYKVAVAGDWGVETATKNVIKLIQDRGYGHLAGVGDNAYEKPDNWITLFNPLKSIMESGFGNHEYSESGGIGPYMTFFGYSKTYFTYKFKNIQFFVIDTNISCDVGSTQHTTIKNALIASQTDNTVVWRCVIMHHPQFGAASDHTYNQADTVGNFGQLFLDNKVNFVFTGHNHNWQRTKQVIYNQSSKTTPTIVQDTGPYSRTKTGIIHVVTGTGGHDSPGSLYPLNSSPLFNAYQNRSHNGVWEMISSNSGNTLTCSFRDTGGNVYDSFVINA